MAWAGQATANYGDQSSDLTQVWVLFRGGRPAFDTTAPTVSGTPDRPADSGSWYNHPTTISWSATDPDNSASDLTLPAPTTADREGKDVTYTSGPACDPAGNCATGSTQVSLDTSAPQVSVTGVNDGATYTVGMATTPGCTASDSLSGLAGTCTVAVTGGNANGVGRYTATATVLDHAGNVGTATATGQVHYRWDGFLQPINDTAHQVGQNLSVFKAGSTVPVKFQLRDVAGAIVAPNSAPVWVVPQQGGPTSSPVDESVYSDPADAGSLYRLSGDTWIYNWKTSAAMSGHYWRIGVRLDDGTTQHVTIGLR